MNPVVISLWLIIGNPLSSHATLTALNTALTVALNVTDKVINALQLVITGVSCVVWQKNKKKTSLLHKGK